MVVAILGVLMAVLVPQYIIQYVEKSRIAADEAYIDEIAHAMEIVMASSEAIYDKVKTVQGLYR